MMYNQIMSKLVKKCSVCGSTKLRPYGSVKRRARSGHKNERRYLCENGHHPSRPYTHLKSLCERWVKHLAIKLKAKGNTYRAIENKLKEYISITGTTRVLGRTGYSHTAIRKWVLQEGLLSKAEEDAQVFKKYLDTIHENFIDKAKIMHQSGSIRDVGDYQKFEWGEQMKNNILATFKNAPEFHSLIRQSSDVDWLWCLKMTAAMYEVAEEKPWEEKERLLQEYPDVIRFFKSDH